MSGCVKMNSPREGSRVNPLTPAPVLSTNCKIDNPCQWYFGCLQIRLYKRCTQPVNGEKLDMFVISSSAESTETLVVCKLQWKTCSLEYSVYSGRFSTLSASFDLTQIWSSKILSYFRYTYGAWASVHTIACSKHCSAGLQHILNCARGSFLEHVDSKNLKYKHKRNMSRNYWCVSRLNRPTYLTFSVLYSNILLYLSTIPPNIRMYHIIFSAYGVCDCLRYFHLRLETWKRKENKYWKGIFNINLPFQ